MIYEVRRVKFGFMRPPLCKRFILPEGRSEFQNGLEKLAEKSVTVRMRRSQIHQSPKEPVGTGTINSDLEFVAHSNKARCQFFSAWSFWLLLGQTKSNRE